MLQIFSITYITKKIRLDTERHRMYNRNMSIDDMTLREEIARAIEAIPIEHGVTSVLGMRTEAASIARGLDNYMTKWFERQVDFE